MNFMQWVPPFQPIRGQYWLVKHVWAEDTWPVAEQDAPWRGYTNLNVNAARTYARARIDWWYRDYHEKHQTEADAIMLFLAFGGTVGMSSFVGGLLWARRRSRQAQPAPQTE